MIYYEHEWLLHQKKKGEDKRVNFSCRNARKGKEERTLKKEKKCWDLTIELLFRSSALNFPSFFFYPLQMKLREKRRLSFENAKENGDQRKMKTASMHPISTSHQVMMLEGMRNEEPLPSSVMQIRPHPRKTTPLLPPFSTKRNSCSPSKMADGH